MQDLIQQLATYIHVPAANTAAVVTLAADTSRRNGIASIHYSYSAAPTGGRLTITDGGTTVFNIDIIAGGENSLYFDPPLAGLHNSAVVVTLAAGGGVVVGKLNIRPGKL